MAADDLSCTPKTKEDVDAGLCEKKLQDLRSWVAKEDPENVESNLRDISGATVTSTRRKGGKSAGTIDFYYHIHGNTYRSFPEIGRSLGIVNGARGDPVADPCQGGAGALVPAPARGLVTHVCEPPAMSTKRMTAAAPASSFGTAAPAAAATESSSSDDGSGRDQTDSEDAAPVPLPPQPAPPRPAPPPQAPTPPPQAPTPGEGRGRGGGHGSKRGRRGRKRRGRGRGGGDGRGRGGGHGLGRGVSAARAPEAAPTKRLRIKTTPGGGTHTIFEY